MSDDVIALRDQVKAALEAIPHLLVGVGDVPDNVKMRGSPLPAKPYAVIYADPGTLSGDRYGGSSQLFDWTFQVTVASGSEDVTLRYTGKVRDALVDLRIEPNNRSAGWLSQYGTSGPVRRDDKDLADIRFFVPLVFTHHTNRT